MTDIGVKRMHDAKGGLGLPNSFLYWHWAMVGIYCGLFSLMFWLTTPFTAEFPWLTLVHKLVIFFNLWESASRAPRSRLPRPHQAPLLSGLCTSPAKPSPSMALAAFPPHRRAPARRSARAVAEPRSFLAPLLPLAGFGLGVLHGPLHGKMTPPFTDWWYRLTPGTMKYNAPFMVRAPPSLCCSHPCPPHPTQGSLAGLTGMAPPPSLPLAAALPAQHAQLP